ncbi:hypothetical protein ABID14_000249 [Peptoniphilus olsenii]|uniref:Phage protein n=1 Tax=Peptoniphilus olsenii TaxID=411570 RepID=A0ABV2JA09_9FIRM
MEKKDIIDFLKFRQKFTPLEWFELNKAISDREKEKAAKLELDDFDVDLIVDRLESLPFVDVED